MKELRFTIDIKKKNDTYTFIWKARNLTKMPLKIKPGMALLDAERPTVHPRFKMLAFSVSNQIMPGADLTLIKDELTKDKVDNYRFWLNRYANIGIENLTARRYFLTKQQFTRIVKKFNNLAPIFGLPEEIDPGLYVIMNKQDKEIDEILNAVKNHAIKAGEGNSAAAKKIIEIQYDEGFNPVPDEVENKTEMIRKR